MGVGLVDVGDFVEPSFTTHVTELGSDPPVGPYVGCDVVAIHSTASASKSSAAAGLALKTVSCKVMPTSAITATISPKAANKIFLFLPGAQTTDLRPFSS